ncbi:hypothetical protein I2485_06160 [Nesterenkonia sp. E16_7]|uniref:hypothetical protein n=1 Tax=Nesterenkonia sp. E16_7 TaxID=2789294 RepID=UPI001A936023|nr:hypothetical protein [Nesterenkonia sp. E16_7]MBO0595557.1 hypothetical protein [Nesterenkonia sp. E16_10]MBO0598234.1 hypothetical protein [Nesterenkonia sp. E16_7]
MDFDPRPGHKEDEEVRRAAYALAHSMEHAIDHHALHARLTQHRSDLGGALSRGKSSRPAARGDGEAVIVHGLKGAPMKDGRRNTRRRTTPAFYGDGALRFQAISDIDFSRVSAQDLVDLIDLTLSHLSSSEPEQSTSQSSHYRVYRFPLDPPEAAAARKGMGGFWRSLQQEVFDQFDRLLKT